ncbi:hypothetical protein Ae201684_000501 [Aphanomyces euteiches]|uniref:CHCH domain-containing protein n=1 Tax=Aphanomyces euteiches TaxID=100861 RepID=A0A6G0XY71_9STRA|nr:hypothetical protein Ae201684_000501 [Aphanomyces euteiches]
MASRDQSTPVMSNVPGQWENGVSREIVLIYTLPSRECTALQKASLKCIEENYTKRENCNEHFERYRECKKKRHAAIIAARRAGKLE